MSGLAVNEAVWYDFALLKLSGVRCVWGIQILVFVVVLAVRIFVCHFIGARPARTPMAQYRLS